MLLIFDLWENFFGLLLVVQRFDEQQFSILDSPFSIFLGCSFFSALQERLKIAKAPPSERQRPFVDPAESLGANSLYPIFEGEYLIIC